MKAVDDTTRRITHAVLRHLTAGQLTVVEDGRARTFGAGEPAALVQILDPRAWTSLLRGSRGLADGYLNGYWDSPDLTAVIRVGARNSGAFDELARRLAAVRVPYQRLRSTWQRNTPQRSRRDIAAHYDLGNDLYELMLDETMSYSCALFEHPGQDLADASRAKLERACRALDLGPDDHVLEIGTGWGGFALHAAATRGCRVTTTTISREQHDVAVQRVHEAGLQDRVTILFEDYRDLRGTYDKLVSIEMIEAVGWQDFGTFFSTCSRLLKPDGVMLLQAILNDDRAYEAEKASKSFITEYIFPGGCLPTNAVIAREVARHTDLRAVDLFDMTPHYPETLRRWRRNIEAHADALEALGYDERFRRLWRLYLSWSEGGFEERRIGVIQTVLAKPRWAGVVRSQDAAAPREAVPAPLLGERAEVHALAGGLDHPFGRQRDALVDDVGLRRAGGERG